MNGSQGVVRQINTEETIYGFMFAKSVIVEFPMSKATFKQLSPHHFPITPISWTFATKINGELICVIDNKYPSNQHLQSQAIPLKVKLYQTYLPICMKVALLLMLLFHDQPPVKAYVFKDLSPSKC